MCHVGFFDMCCRAIKRLQAKNPLENDISIPFFTMMANNSAGLLEIEENLGKKKVVPDCPSCADGAELSVEFTQVVLDRFQFLLETTPYHSLQCKKK